MKKTTPILALLGIGLLLLVACAPVERTIVLKEGDETSFNTLTTTGTSELDFAPDQAEAWITIENRADTAKNAQQTNSETSEKVIAAMRAQGAAKDDIETASYSVTPIYEWDGKLERSVFRGYQVTHTLKLTTTRTENVGDFLDAAVSAGANNVQNVQFSLSKAAMKKAREQALGDAAKDARSKADALTSGVGVSIVKVRSVSESGFNAPPIIPYYDRAMLSAEAGYAKAIPPIQQEKVQVSASVMVVYEIGS